MSNLMLTYLSPAILTVLLLLLVTPQTRKEQLLSVVVKEFNYFSDAAWLALKMHITTLSAWVEKMRDPTQPGDKIAIFAFSKIFQSYNVVYSKTKIWNTIGTSSPVNEKCDLKSVFMV